MKTLQGRVAVVTGAAGGIGKGLAQVLVAEGVSGDNLAPLGGEFA